jgi:spore maturation protein CgeB
VLTDRPFEIAASGVPLVAERSEAQSELFPEGEAALYFDCVDELAMNVKVLSSDRHLGLRLANAAYEIAARQTYDSRFDEIVRVLDSWGHAVN